MVSATAATLRPRPRTIDEVENRLIMRTADLEEKPAFLTILAGGTGLASGQFYREFYESDGRPFPMVLLHMDTDRRTQAFVDHVIFFGLDARKVEVIKANPKRFGPVAVEIVEHYLHLLNPEDAPHGSKTVRMLCQLAFQFHLDHIIRELQKCILTMMQQGGFNCIIPVIVSSTAGGTGSALQVLLPQALKDRAFYSRLTVGLKQPLVHTPVSFVVDPFAYTLAHPNIHADRILANSYAFRIESAHLEHQHAYKYIFHLGLGNECGAVLDSPEDIARVLGTCVYHCQRHWKEIRSETVNNSDMNVNNPYAGDDLPELVLGAEFNDHADDGADDGNGDGRAAD